MKLTARQEKFASYIVQGLSQHDAYIKAGYSSNIKPASIDRLAHDLIKNIKITSRITELKSIIQKEVVERIVGHILTIEERKVILSEIASANLTDYQESGQDGGWINIGKESPNTRAISEIVSTTKYDENGANPTLITRIRLHNPTQAVDLLNKMDKLYDAGTQGTDNRSYHLTYNIINPDTKVLLARLENDGRLELNRDISQEPKQLSEPVTEAVTERRRNS